MQEEVVPLGVANEGQTLVLDRERLDPLGDGVLVVVDDDVELVGAGNVAGKAAAN